MLQGQLAKCLWSEVYTFVGWLREIYLIHEQMPITSINDFLMDYFVGSIIRLFYDKILITIFTNIGAADSYNH